MLLGDPQQLDQPLKGIHPPGAEASALGHLLGDHATIPADRGLFLETTWRCTRNLCRFTSEAFYENKLPPQPNTDGQQVIGSGSLEPRGYVDAGRASARCEQIGRGDELRVR